MDAGGIVTGFNPAAERCFGVARKDAVGRPMADLIGSPELRERHRRGVERYLATGEARVLGRRIEMPARRVDGRDLHVELTVYRIPGHEPPVFRAFLRDITERKRAEAALRESEERLARALEASGLALWDTDIRTGSVFLSEGWSRMLGDASAPTRTTVHALAEVVHPGDLPALRQLSLDAIKGIISEYDVEHRVRNRAGGWIWIQSRGKVVERDPNGFALRMTGTNAEITQRKEAERRVHHLATRDALTELPNRLLLSDRLSQALAAAQRERSKLAVLFIDLDRFKNINDSLGHHVGDVLLRVAAARLSACVRREDTVARQGGDEFIVLLPSLDHPRDASKVAHKLLEALAAPFDVEGQLLHATASIGIAIYPDDGADATTLLKHSDAALYHAKEAGRNRVQFFAAPMNELARQRHDIESRLRGALERGELSLAYQPRVDLASRGINGFEALLRWESPELGRVPPKQFIAVAEDSGLIVPIGRWVLAQACRQARRWHDAGHPHLRISVNVSAQQMRERDFAETLAHALASSGLDARLLELEITESVMMESSQQAADRLDELTRLGVTLAIDDFGTGYSGLSYLRRLPVDRLKIDRSFVHDIASDAGSAAIVCAVIAMAKSLDLHVIAEGVETSEQLAFLVSHGCAEAQGHYFSPAVPAAEAEALLRASPWRTARAASP
jgi:diguanylate cyclase (GGDEF)-like protein/PAS domain S-box-containing protein